MATDPWGNFIPVVEDPWAKFTPVGEREWKDVPLEALKNVPRSAANLAQAVVQPILHPIDTAKALGGVASGLISKAGRPGNLLREGDAEPTPEELQRRATVEAPADALGQFFKDRYGGGEAIKNTLATDPVGALADALAVAAPATGAVRAPLTGMAGALTKGVGKVAEPLASNALGFATGAGVDAVREAAKAGRAGNTAFVENMRGKVPMTDVLDQAKGALGQMREDRNAAYQSGMTAVRNDSAVLDLKPIEEALNSSKGVGTFGDKTVNPQAVAVQEKIAATLTDWKASDPAKYHTPAGLDALKQAVGAIREETLPHTRARVVADNVYRAVGDTIKAQAPTYATTMGEYAGASKQIGEVERAFSLGEKSMQDTGMRKLQSVMRNNVNTNFGNRQALADALAEHAPDLRASIAGQAMSSPTPRGLAKLGPLATFGAATINPAALGALLVESPRLVGEGLYAAGRGTGAVSDLAQSLGVNGRNARVSEQVGFQGGRAKQEIEARLARLLMRANEQGAR
jgi:hypothetical protein